MPEQMAIDEILLKEPDLVIGGFEKKPVFRFFYSDKPWLSVGYSVDTRKLNLESSQPVCKRVTGGGLVQHDKDLMFSIIASKKDDESFESVRLSYLKIHEMLRDALFSLGIECDFYRCDENLPRGQECFVYPIATDLRYKGQKIAGGAQKRSAGRFLHQESIQLPHLNYEQLSKAILASLQTKFNCGLDKMKISPELFKKAKALASEKYFKEFSEVCV